MAADTAAGRTHPRVHIRAQNISADFRDTNRVDVPLLLLKGNVRPLVFSADGAYMTVVIDSPTTFVHPPHSSPYRAGGPSVAELSDGDLLEAVRHGRVEAYGILFTRHKNAAISIAKGVLGNHDLAVDIAHEAFSNILAAIRGGAGPVDTFKGYLRATVTRLCYRQAKQASMEMPVAEHAESNHPTEDFTDQLFDPALREAFKSLPPGWQQAIWYLDVEDQQPGNVAALFGLTPNALVSLHRRAKKGLTRAYNHHQPNNHENRTYGS